jgi:hypothetical protein
MLVSYIYVSHQMERMQEFVDFIFFEVWCKAPIGLEFDLEFFNGNPELKEVLSEFGFSANAPVRGRAFYLDIKAIYQLFAALSPQQIDQFKIWYRCNNEIEKACSKDPFSQLARYDEILVEHEALAEKLASFYSGLYAQALLGLAGLKKKIGDIDDHYTSFAKANNLETCPFCGISPVLGENHSGRDAYDHYLPKSLYPFNSINFRNLAPACHHCNSTYKLGKDPAHNASGRRKAFYPYATDGHNIDITVDFGKCNMDRLKLGDIQLTYGPASIHEEIKTWREVYEIDERYKAKCCGHDAKDWLEQFRIMRNTLGIDLAAFLAVVQQQAKSSPIANGNFLKWAFLEGCQRAGLLEDIANEGAEPR